MYNNQKRVELVKRRIYERNCQQQRHGIYGLSAACMVLFAFLAGMLHVVAGHTQMAAQECTVLSCCIKMQEATCL